MNALEKLNAVLISVDNRISETDRRFCEAHQTAYREAKQALCELEYMWTDIVNRQEEILSPVSTDRYSFDSYAKISHFSAKDIHERLEALHGLFIVNLVRYFNRNYRVSLDSESIIDVLLPQKSKNDSYSRNIEAEEEYLRQLSSMMLDYKEVLDQIFIQLNGRTFRERAIDEIKEKCHQAAWNTYHGNEEYELKNDVIRFTYGCHYENWLNKDRWKLNDGMKEILRGMSYFETEVLGHYPGVIADLLGWSDKDYSVVEFSGMGKLKSLRMFKKGRVDVKFRSREYARQFVSEYLGLVC